MLIIDDEPSLLFMLTDRLQAEGYAVESERDGEAGLTRASSDTFDVMILDGMLPGRHGFDVCQTLRERGIRTPVVMLSARGWEALAPPFRTGTSTGTSPRPSDPAP